ncbi:MAG: hypothetical protein KAT12_00530, partial [Gammaproteobacteria bacterium]|nr:hypothetical protein [Gammaproteobacteria bacterium]
MYLFVSCVCPKLAGLKKAGFFAALLLSSLVAHATPSTVEKTAAVVTPQSDQMTDAGKQHFNFPRWPQRQKAVREIIPPPPPGPYMSSALSDYSVRAPSFGRDMNKDVKPNPARMRDSAPVSMDDFSPDIPWPKNLRQGHENH